MTMNHGIKTNETMTSIATISQTGNTAVVIGTAPVNLAKTPKVNEPILCYTEKEALEYFGYSEDWAHYTLSEAINVFFRLFKKGPVVFINVLDPAKHKTSVTGESITITNKQAVINVKGILLSSIRITGKTAGTDFTTHFNDNGTVTIVALTDMTGGQTLAYDKLNPSAVTGTDIIGGVDAHTLKISGLALIPKVFAKYNRVPNILLAPGWSDTPTVAKSMVSSMKGMSEVFNGIVLTDIEASITDNYTKAGTWKTTNGYTSEIQYNFWPRAKLGSIVYHMSTLVAASIYIVDDKNNGIPFESPSNKPLKTTGICLKNGTLVELDLNQASHLNDNGIATSINFNNGWVLWGNRTGAYPASNDIKDTFITNKRMFIWDNNNFILTYWLDVDKPATPKLMDKIVDSYNNYYSGLKTSGAILGGRVVFDRNLNPVNDLMNGKYYFKRYFTPVGVAEVIESDLEYDIDYLKNLFGGGN